MPSTIDHQRQQLRIRIARSRRRLDRHARSLADDAARLVPFARTRSFPPTWSLLLALAAGMAWKRWAHGELAHRWGHHLMGRSVLNGLDRLLRQLRVAVWRLRRTTSSDTGEVTDE